MHKIMLLILFFTPNLFADYQKYYQIFCTHEKIELINDSIVGESSGSKTFSISEENPTRTIFNSKHFSIDKEGNFIPGTEVKTLIKATYEQTTGRLSLSINDVHAGSIALLTHKTSIQSSRTQEFMIPNENIVDVYSNKDSIEYIPQTLKIEDTISCQLKYSFRR